MIPASFDYLAPTTVADALAALAEHGDDAKVLCVPPWDSRWEDVHDLDQTPAHLMDEIKHFFDVYKLIEPGKESTTGTWAGAAEAWGEIRASRERYPR